MARGDPISLEERQRMAQMARAGESIGQIARTLDRAPSTISVSVREEGVTPELRVGAANLRTMKDAQDGRERWDARRRTQLGAQAFDKLEAVLPAVDKMRDLRDWSVAFGVMTDKMRLESDLSTQNVEVHEHLTIEQRQAIRELLTG